jgi:hypothetical protein
VSYVLPASLEVWFLQFRSFFSEKARKKSGIAIWFFVIWSLWLSRNAVIFNSENVVIPQILDLIKTRFWSWFYANGDTLVCYLIGAIIL